MNASTALKIAFKQLRKPRSCHRAAPVAASALR